MTLLSIKDAGFVALRPLFQDLSLSLAPGDRIGLVALNGAGKSTLLRCLADELDLTRGEIVRSRGARIGHMAQEIAPELMRLSFRDAVLGGLDAETRAQEGWRVDMALDTLEAPSELRDAPVSNLSGGWRRLMALARVWIAEPDILLMDEPTNHLDLEKILLLERWLDAWLGDAPLIVASHDRGFLDASTNRTLFLRPERSRLYALPYSRALEELARADEADASERERDLKQAQRLRRQSAKLKNIGVNSGSDLLLKKQKQLRARAEKIEESVNSRRSERAGEIRLVNRDTHAKALIRLSDLTVSAPDDRVLFKIENLEIFRGDRVVILGRNGEGKSTLVRLLRAALTKRDENPNIKITPSLLAGYIDQELSDMPLDETPFDYVSGHGPDDARSRSTLAAAGIAHDHQDQPIRRLSFGQRSRLALLALRFVAPNFYLLDEPTNHVDIAGQEALAEEIRERGASCLLVSHDRAFVRDVGNRFFVIQQGGLAEAETPEPYFARMAFHGNAITV